MPPPRLCLSRARAATLPLTATPGRVLRPPTCWPVPLQGTQGRQDTLRARDTSSTPYRNTWGRGAAGNPRPRRAAGPAAPGPPVATVLQVPTSAPGAAREPGAGEGIPAPRLFVGQPRRPRPCDLPDSRSQVPAREAATSRCRARAPPGPSSWHSQWRRGCSCKLGPVGAAGAQAGPEPEALQSERTTRR